MKRYLLPIPHTVFLTGVIMAFLYAISYESFGRIEAPSVGPILLVSGTGLLAMIVYSLSIDDKPPNITVEPYVKEENDLHYEATPYYPMARNSIIHVNNEMGVVAAFASVCNSMGYVINKIQVKFPDAIVREIATGKLLRVEFEYESRNFKNHGHDADECDLIICWKHNYHDCPLPVIEMREKW